MTVLNRNQYCKNNCFIFNCLKHINCWYRHFPFFSNFIFSPPKLCSGPTHPSAAPFGHPPHHPGNVLTPASHIGQNSPGIRFELKFKNYSVNVMVTSCESPQKLSDGPRVLADLDHSIHQLLEDWEIQH